MPAILIALLFLLCPAAFSADLSDRVLTLDDSLRVALGNSQLVLYSREDVNIALQRVREAQSLFFPKIDLNTNWSRFSVEGPAPFLLQPNLGPTILSPTGNADASYFTARANVYQTLYQGGRSRNTYRQARILYERARISNDALVNEVQFSAKQAFYDFLFAREKVREYSEAMRRSENLTNSNGAISLDQLRLENEMAGLRSDLAAARLELAEHRLAFLRALNLELSTSVQLKGELVTHPAELDLQKMLAWATRYRAELRQTEFQEELDSLGISLSQAERTPTIGFGASYERAGTQLELPQANWATTFNVNLPVSVSDMIYGWARVRQRRSQFRQTTLKHAEMTDQIYRQVREAFTQYQYWQDELPSRQREYNRAEKLMQGLRQKALSRSDRAEAEQLVLKARIRYLESVHGHLQALASLERAVGHPIDSLLGPG